MYRDVPASAISESEKDAFAMESHRKALDCLAEAIRLAPDWGYVHALALANLGELTSGLAMLPALPAGVRGIPTRLCIDFYKKARGRLVAVSRSTPPKVVEDMDFEVHTDIHDHDDEVVARITVNWRLGLVTWQL